MRLSISFVSFWQKFLDDIGVVISMIAITLIAVIVVTIKVVLLYQEVRHVFKFNNKSR